MKKQILIVMAVTFATLSVAGCAGVGKGKGKGKAPPPVAAEPIIRKG